MRVETRDGVLVVYDAAAPPEADEGCSGYIGYWLSARDQTQYIFPAVLQAQGDLATVLLALERDLGVDLEALADSEDRVDTVLRASAEAPNEAIVWEPATLRRAIEIMGFDPGNDPDLNETGDGQAAAVCDPGGCPVRLDPPRNCGSPEGLALEAWAVAVECCPPEGGGGGGGCSGPCCGVSCYDGDPCTYDYCSTIPSTVSTEQAFCHNDPLSGVECWDDQNPCTNDVCQNGFCTHPNRTGACNPSDCWDSEYCLNGACVLAGWACEDATPCMSVSCEVTYSKACIVTNSCREHCVYTSVNELCDDNNVCTDDWCLDGVCQNTPLTGSACTDDGNPCTNDVCDSGVCRHPNTTCPDDGLYCNGMQFCEGGICRSGGEPCPPELLCDEEHDACVECITGADCDDGDPCTQDSCWGWTGATSGWGGVAKGKCENEPLCPDGQSCCAGGCCDPGMICCDGSCQAPSCSLNSGPVMICPGGTAEADALAVCAPACVNMQITAEVVEPEYMQLLTVAVAPTSVLCGPMKSPVSVTIRALPEAPQGVATVQLTGQVTVDGEIVCQVATNIVVTVMGSLKVPLGGNLASTGNPACFRAYVPTRWGGQLNIQTTAGAITDLAHPDGNPYMNNAETGEGKHGWYTFKVVGAQSYTVSASFTQEGESTKRPWNFYWWSTNHPLLNLYETTGTYQPLVKYDALHGTSARDWEAANHSTPVDWCGHCLGCAIASITLPQPAPTTGTAYNSEEVEALWCELGEHSAGHVFGDRVFSIPPGPPVAGTDVTDGSAPILHALLEEHVKSTRIPLYAQLRSDGGAADEVWNHAVFKFVATFQEAPGGNEKVVKITNIVTANDDLEPPTDDLSTRDPVYVYIITYGTNGITDPAAAKDWISVGGDASFAPWGLAVIAAPSWVANNPSITEANVRADDGAN